MTPGLMARALVATGTTALLALALMAAPAAAKPAEDKQPGNPPGNNGTIKVDALPFDDHKDNEPHVTCRFEIDFYNFDEGDLSADVEFALHAPTGSGRLTANPSEVFIGEDPAGGHDGGDDLDAAQEYDLTAALAASGATPHPKQGYHVKLTIHAEGSQGNDTKHKVFWIQPCGAVAPDTTVVEPNPDETDGGGNEVGGNEIGGNEVVKPQTGGTSVAGATFRPAVLPAAPTAEPTVLGTQFARTEPATLARTGSSFGLTVAVAFGLLLLGFAMTRAVRLDR